MTLDPTEIPERVAKMRDEMAAACVGTLRCGRCGHEQACDADDAAVYLREGWPKHCDATMTLVPSSPDVIECRR